MDRTDIKSFLINTKQSELDPKNIYLPLDVDNTAIIKYVCNEYLKNFVFSESNKVDEFSRTIDDILNSKIFFGENEIALIESSLLREKRIPAICVYAASVDKKTTYTFIEVFLDNKWCLVDPMNGRIHTEYDYNNLSLPDGYIIYRKALNNYSFGVFSKENMLGLINSYKSDGHR